MVDGQNERNAKFVHSNHGYAVYKTVPFVHAIAVQFESLGEGRGTLWNDSYVRMPVDSFYYSDTGLAHIGVSRNMSQELGKNLLGSNQIERKSYLTFRIKSRPMPLVVGEIPAQPK